MKAYSDFIKVRAGQGSEKNKVYVKGYASMMNKPDIYNFTKLPNGKFRTFKSIFTDNCVKDMKKQLENSAIFVDGMHSTATDMGILNLAEKYNFDEDDKTNVEAALKMKKLPLAKLVDFDIDENGLIIGTETNPNFAKVDEEHKGYYEAVTGSLIDGYLKGYSINFDVPKDGMVSEIDSDGNQLDFIDKVEFYGMSYTDNPALPDNSFVDVCMRSMGSFMKVRSMEGKDENETKVVEEVKTQEKTVKSEPVDVSTQVQKLVKEELDRRNQESEQETIARERDDYKKQLDDINNKRDEVTGNTNVPVEKQGVSVVPQQDKYKEGIDASNLDNTEVNGMDALKKIKEPYDKYMAEINRPTSEGEVGVRKIYPTSNMNPYNTYGQVLELQREFALHQRPLEGESANDFQRRLSVLNDGNSDMVVKHSVKI